MLSEQLERFPDENGASPHRAGLLAGLPVAERRLQVAGVYSVLEPGGLAAVTCPMRGNFMRFEPAGTEGVHLHELADLEAAFRDVGFIERRTERNDAVRFGAHCMPGRQPARH